MVNPCNLVSEVIIQSVNKPPRHLGTIQLVNPCPWYPTWSDLFTVQSSAQCIASDLYTVQRQAQCIASDLSMEQSPAQCIASDLSMEQSPAQVYCQ